MRGTSYYTAGTAAACLAIAGGAQAAWGKQQTTPPSTIDVPEPSPAASAKSDSASAAAAAAAADPSLFSQATIVTEPTLPPYHGLEYKFGPFRIRPAELKMEGVMLAVLFAYLALTFLIRKANKSRATSWFKANESILREEFAGVGLGGDKLFAVDGGDEFVSYVTGRRAIESGWVKLRTGGYDVLVKAYTFIRGITDYGFDAGDNKIVIDFKLTAPGGTPGAKFCFAVVRRDVLKSTRDARWDMRTFTNTTEYAGISPELIVMTESGDITNALLKDQVTGLQDALKAGAEGIDYLESLILTDMPGEEPDENKPTLPTDEFHLILTLRLPPASASASTKPFLSLACNIADVLYKKEKLLPDVAVSKAKKRRADALAELEKALRAEEKELEAEKKADALALKRKLEKQKLEQRLAGMSPAERMKAKQKEEEKERKKLVQKMSKRQR
ncbi:hypothetical protein JCM5296_000079 [Sporobolomyces johnsonii]